MVTPIPRALSTESQEFDDSPRFADSLRSSADESPRERIGSFSVNFHNVPNRLKLTLFGQVVAEQEEEGHICVRLSDSLDWVDAWATLNGETLVINKSIRPFVRGNTTAFSHRSTTIGRSHNWAKQKLAGALVRLKMTDITGLPSRTDAFYPERACVFSLRCQPDAVSTQTPTLQHLTLSLHQDGTWAVLPGNAGRGPASNLDLQTRVQHQTERDPEEGSRHRCGETWREGFLPSP